jgi:hypothetical protein
MTSGESGAGEFDHWHTRQFRKRIASNRAFQRGVLDLMMSCDGNRNRYFQNIAETAGATVTAQVLERVFQAGRNRSNADNGAERQKNEAQTRLLFVDMKAQGLRPPTHSKNWLPKVDAQAGYGAVYQHLQKVEYFGVGGRQQQKPVERVAEQTARVLKCAGVPESQADKIPEGALPVSIRDVPPGKGAQRLTGETSSGLPSGVHSGGAWLWQGEVWKPLDGRPYMNCRFHYPTQEAECLAAMAGRPLFPRNWRVESRNGREWIVRKPAYLIPEDVPYADLDKEQILEVEKGVRELNRNHWEVGDHLALALDPDTYQLFIYDLSTTTHRPDGRGAYQADETDRIRKFFEACGADRLLDLRSNARKVTQLSLESDDWEQRLERRRQGYEHVYASFSRPIDAMWASFPGDPIYEHTEGANRNRSMPHTWVITKEPLSDEIMRRYELTWGWSLIHPSERKQE